MYDQNWTREKISEWVKSQDWYQTIPVVDGIATQGSTDSVGRLKLLQLPDLVGKTVLDVGCNSGMYCFECKKKNASKVVGIDPQIHRIEQARTLAAIMKMEVEFMQMGLFEARQLGEFDIVLCFAVVTEMTDLIQALLTLKDMTRETLYLELSVADSRPFDFGLPLRWLGLQAGHALSPLGMARLRKTKTGWAITPSMKFLRTLLGDKFEIVDLGRSVRYRLLKLIRKG